MTIKLRYKKLHDLATLERATTGAIGYDLVTTTDIDHDEIVVGTGIAVELTGTAGLVIARSSLAKKGYALANSVGLIDLDYRGEIKLHLKAISKDRVKIKAGERIAQLVLMKVAILETEEADILSETARGDGGFGSTDTTVAS